MSYTPASLGAAKGVVGDSFCGRAPSPADPNDPGVGGPDAAYDFYSDGSKKLKACCSADTWSNATINAIMGPDAVRGFNEVRIHSIADQLRRADRKVGGTGLSSSLASRLDSAFASFEAKFPRGRWAAAPGPFRNADCSGAGTYSTIVDAQNRPVTNAQRSVINSVPGGEPSSNVMRKPTLKSLFVYSSSGPQPGPWLSSFLNEFSPREATTRRRVASRYSHIMVNRPLLASPAGPTSPAPSPPSSPSPSSPPSVPTPSALAMPKGAKYAIAVGTILVLGGGAYHLLKKR